MQTITLSALAVLLAQISRVTEIEILTRTDARARKNPYGRIDKESRVIGNIGGTYKRAVNIALIKQISLPTFKPASRKWGQNVGGALVEHKGEYYAAVHVTKSMWPRFVKDGYELTRQEIGRFLPARYHSQRQADKGLTGEKQIHYVNYALRNIVEIKIDGTFYKVVPDAPRVMFVAVY